MLLTLLSQAVASQSPPYAIYATLAVGVLSLIASALNIYFSSKTAQKVVNLSTKTTKEVAELSAQVSRESAGLAAKTAKEIKDKDYKNDFYKRIIEKRLNAWVEAESFISLIFNTSYVKGYGKLMPCYFNNEKHFDEVVDRMRLSLISQTFWMGRDYATCIMKFHDRLLSIRSECEEYESLNEDGSNKLNNSLLHKAGVEYFEECGLFLNKLMSILEQQIIILHDVEYFFKQQKNLQFDRSQPY